MSEKLTEQESRLHRERAEYRDRCCAAEAESEGLKSDLNTAINLIREMRAFVPADLRPHSLFRRSGAAIASQPEDSK